MTRALPPLLVLAGATATGKTGLAISVAHALREAGTPAEVISADSRQVFRGLDIGTAKAPFAEHRAVPHHGLDLVDPDEAFSVADFVRHARAALSGIAAQGGLAILAGGTGLYLRAVARGFDTEALPFDPVIRAAIEAGLAADGPAPAVARLRALAPRLAARIDTANPRRVARALEIAELRGDAPPPPALGYDAPIAWIGLQVAPATHAAWIAARARQQFEAGLIDEARGLRDRYDPALPAFSAIGYREAWAVLDGELSQEQAIELDARRNLQFARRQATWFRSEPGIEWLDAAADPLPRALEVAHELVATASEPDGVLMPIRLPGDRVHAWRMERQLLGREQAADPAAVARRLIGVQAQVTSSAALSIALRSKAPRGPGAPVEATARALLDRSLVRTWAMRGTLHLFAAEDVHLIAAAIENRQMWRRPAWLRWFGLTEPEMEALIEAIGEILDDGVPRTRAELSVVVGERLGPKAGRHLLGSWGSVLKIASDHHFLVQSAETDAGVRFVRASRWIKGWRQHDGEGAMRDIVLRYLAAYGPASIKEVLRWWGTSIFRDVKRVFVELGDTLTEVEVDGARAFVSADDVTAIEATRTKRGTVRLLGGFDPLLVGGGLRRQLIPDAFLARVSRTAGWISPVVLLDGRAIAVWDSKVTGSSLTITVDPFEAAPPALRTTIGEAAERISDAQGLRLALGFGRVFDRPARKLAVRPADA